jgi:hypothetical protein
MEMVMHIISNLLRKNKNETESMEANTNNDGLGELCCTMPPIRPVEVS